MRRYSHLLAGMLAGIILVLLVRELSTPEHPVPGDRRDSSLIPASYAVDIQDQIRVERQNAVTNAVALVEDAVVGINVTQIKHYVQQSPFHRDPFFRQFFPDRMIERTAESLGSGFIISDDGFLVTNEHVVHNASEIIVTLPNGNTYPAEIVGSDFATDVAMLKIEETGLPFIPMGTSSDLIIGEWVIALGNPYGLFAINDKPSVTVGVISAVDRDFGRQQNNRIYKDMIQTDAAINPGNSGGPLVNVLGELVGMNTMIYSESGGSVGLGFAIPVDQIRNVISELREFGQIRRNYWTGIYIQDLDRMIAYSLNYPGTDGAVVTEVEPGSPGEKAGVKVADVIVQVNNQPVTNRKEIEELLLAEDLRVGDRLQMTLFRDGETIVKTVVLEEKN